MKQKRTDSNGQRISPPVSEMLGASRILFIIITAALVVTVFSKTSFLYIFDDGPDITCMFEVGRRVIGGDVLYRDVVEQKGLYLILFYGLASLISEASYTGVYLFEIILAGLSLWLVKKCLDIYGIEWKRQAPLLIMAAVQFFGCTYTNHGGDVAEILLLPVFLHVYYCGLRKIKQGISPNYFLIGLLAGLVFWVKYNLVVVFAVWWIFEAVSAFRGKSVRALILNTCKIAAGVILSGLPVLIYFVYHGALYDMFNVYFVLNITGYPSRSLSEKLLLFITSFLSGFTPFVVIAGTYYSVKGERGKPKSTFAYNLLYMSIFTAYLFLSGTKITYYYALYLALIVPQLMFFSTLIDSLKSEKVKRRAGLAFAVGCITFTAILSNTFPYLLTQNAQPGSKWAEWNTRIAYDEMLEYIQTNRQEEGLSVLCLGIDCCPFYRYADCFPDTKYPIYLNARGKEMASYYRDSINNRDYEFMLVPDTEFIPKGYEAVLTENIVWQRHSRKFVLYQRSGTIS